MEIRKIRRDCIGNNSRLIAVVKGLACSFFHADLGHGAGDDEGFDARWRKISSSFVP